MLSIRKEYVISEDNKKKAVVIDIDTFEKLEEVLENFGLGKYMEEIDNEEILTIKEAQQYYDSLKKSE